MAPAKGKSTKSPTKAAGRAAAQKGADESRSNKKAEVIAMMKRAKGVTLAEIMEATAWQAHTVRGFVSILCSKGGETVESAKNSAGERSYRIAKQPKFGTRSEFRAFQRRFRLRPGRRCCFAFTTSFKSRVLSSK